MYNVYRIIYIYTHVCIYRYVLYNCRLLLGPFYFSTSLPLSFLLNVSFASSQTNCELKGRQQLFLNPQALPVLKVRKNNHRVLTLWILPWAVWDERRHLRPNLFLYMCCISLSMSPCNLDPLDEWMKSNLNKQKECCSIWFKKLSS